ncbi:intramolecular oxidoreductase [Fragilaria crotonensis]|nr:intramolecular oxidoreductase [Fragilaria crotonensis]
MMLQAFLVFLSVLTVVSGDGLHLTADNYDLLTADKSVFIKYYAPWCGHCKKLAPEWDKLAADWVDSPMGLVAEVDCTSPDGKNCVPRIASLDSPPFDEAVKQEWQAILFKSDEEIQALIAEERKKLKDANKEFKLRSKEMENQYNKILADKETKIKEINESVLDIARSIKAFKEKKQRHIANGEEL